MLRVYTSLNTHDLPTRAKEGGGGGEEGPRANIERTTLWAEDRAAGIAQSYIVRSFSLPFALSRSFSFSPPCLAHTYSHSPCITAYLNSHAAHQFALLTGTRHLNYSLGTLYVLWMLFRHLTGSNAKQVSGYRVSYIYRAREICRGGGHLYQCPRVFEMS